VVQTAGGARIRVRTSGGVELPALSARISHGLVQAGVQEPDVAIETVGAFARQASGKFKRFVPL
jgi:hypothetical protein